MKTKSFGTFSPGEEDMSAYPDDQLVLEALDDSHQAFEQLVKQYQYRVLRTIASIVSDEQATQDVAQETFLSAWSNLAKLKERHKFGRWLNQTAVNLSKRWLRDQRRYRENATSFMDMFSLTQERQYQRDRLRYEIWEAIDELSEDYREAVILHYISGYSYREIGEMLSVPVSTVSGRLQKAKNQLRKEFLDMVAQLQLEIDSAVHKILKKRAKQDGISVENLIIRLVERYVRDVDSSGIAVRKVGNMVSGGRPSPDGRYLSFTNWNYGDLAIRDLITGEERDLTDGGQSWENRVYWVCGSVWSPDSKQIAYDWCSYHDDHPDELRIVGLDGSEPRVLYSDEDKEAKFAYVHDWSQDGKFILAQIGDHFNPGQKWEIALVSVTDGSVHVLKSLEADPPPAGRRLYTFMNIMRLTPDGRHVVYSRSVKENDGNHDIFLLATDGSGAETPLVEHPADDYGAMWAPDGKSIVFVSDRSSSYDVWIMPVADGKPAGEPQLVKRDPGEAVRPMGLTREGSLYYGLWPYSGDIYVAKVDPETGELLEPPTKAIRQFEGFNHSPAWSPDGKSLAYVSMRSSPGGTHRRPVLVIRSEETGEERELRPETGYRKMLGNLRWSPDGRSIVSVGPWRHDCSIHLIDTQTGDATTIVKFEVDPANEVMITGFAWSLDGKTIFYARRMERTIESCRIIAHDLETGKEKELCRENVKRLGLAVSPDGRLLAFGDIGALKVMPVEGGEPRELLRLPSGPGFACGPVWTPDGRYILFGKGEKPGEICRIPAEGGEPQKLFEAEEINYLLANLSVHPDGQRVAFTPSGKEPFQVWAMDNVLAKFAADK